jgi:hypothetical protein
LGYSAENDGLFPALVSPAATYATKLLSNSTNTYMRWKEATQDTRLLNYEIGQFEDVTFVENPMMILWNVGTVLASASITAALEPGDGAAETVDAHWTVGASNATHYVQLSSISDPGAAETGFKLNDMVTLCRSRVAANGATGTANGVQWDHADNITARIASINYDTNRIGLEVPVLNEKYSTALGTGMYGWAIKGRPVHATIFLKRGLADPGVGGVVMEPPAFYVNEPQDPRKAVWTFSWDAYLDYVLMDPDAYEVHFHAGHIRRGGSVLSL